MYNIVVIHCCFQFADIEIELDKIEIKKGSFLDLGTGPGTQAIKLFKRGFDVTVSDLSPSSIHKESVRYNEKLTTRSSSQLMILQILI